MPECVGRRSKPNRKQHLQSISSNFETVIESIRLRALPSAIKIRAIEAFNLNRAVLKQMREAQMLLPAVHRSITETAGDSSVSRHEAETLLFCMNKVHAQPHEIIALLEHLPSEDLKSLYDPALSDVPSAQAVIDEINNRPQRLASLLQIEVNLYAATRHEVSVSPPGELPFDSTGSDMMNMQELRQQALEHCIVFEAPAPPALRDALDEFEKLMANSKETPLHFEQINKMHRTANHLLSPKTAKRIEVRRDAQIETLKERARTDVRTLVKQLASPPALRSMAYCLDGCAQAVVSIQALGKALGAEPTSGGTSGTPVPAEQIREAMDALSQESRQAIDATFNDPEFAAILTVLSTIITETRHRNLPELAAKAETALATLTHIADLVNIRETAPLDFKSVDSSRTCALLQPATVNALSKHFSVNVSSQGDAELTIGRVPDSFRAIMATGVALKASEDERAIFTLPDGTVVPKQFVTDGERDGITYLLPDGLPLIDRNGWARLNNDDKYKRIGKAYARLVRFYQGNEAQASAILRLANQGLTSAFKKAANAGLAESPLQIPGHGPGSVERSAAITQEQTVVTFSISDKGVPRARLSYEIRGGRFDPPRRSPDASNFLESGAEHVYLDEASRAAIAIDIEPNPDGTGISMIGTPIYDVHLIISDFQQPFPVPRFEHLLDIGRSGDLYSAFYDYARDHVGLDAAHAILALRKLVRALNRDETQRNLEMLYDQHLKPGGNQPISNDSPKVDAVREWVGTNRHASREISESEMQRVLPPLLEHLRATVEPLLSEFIIHSQH